MNKTFRDPRYSFFFLAPDINWGLSLLPLIQPLYLIHPTTDPLAKKFAAKYFYSPPLPNTANSGKLLSSPLVREFIEKNREGTKAVIFPFKTSAKIAHLSQANSWQLAAPASGLNRLLENKVSFSRLISQTSTIPQIPHLLSPLNKNSFLKASRRFGLPLLIQKSHGWAGKSSFLCNNFAETEKSFIPEQIVKYSPYLKGKTYTVNAYFGRFGSSFSPPADQFTGISSLTDNPFSTCGRQWPATISPSAKKQIDNINKKFTKILANLGYRGFFGLDFLNSNGKTFLLECNPRLTASFALYSHLEKNAGMIPLLYYHLAEFLPLSLPKLKDRFYHRFSGAEIIYRLPQNSAPEYPPRHFSRAREVFTDAALLEKKSFFLSASPQKKVNPGAEMFRVVAKSFPLDRKKNPLFDPQIYLKRK